MRKEPARFPLLVQVIVVVTIHASTRAWGQEAAADSPQTCIACHDRSAKFVPPGPPQEVVAQSAHSAIGCDACHASISMDELDAASPRPHGPGPHPVDCGECHEDEAEFYTRHGRMTVGRDRDIPACWDCHGHHDILPSSDRQSHVHLSNLARTCMSCHTDVDLVKQHDILREAPIRLYESSVHGRASRKGLYAAANCSHCHSSRGEDGRPTAHRILGAADADSTIYHFNIPRTCGQCHESIAADFREGIHGRLVERGEVDAPVCTTCHGEHGIISPDDPASPVSAARVAEQTCAPCHESVVLNEKYGIPGGLLKSYVDSYHGHKSKAGDVRVANCASCHGAHRILPSTDPTSSIHSDNLQETCGECHPGISPELAKTGIHATVASVREGWPEFFRKLYIVLIVVTIGSMLVHNIADWASYVRRISREAFVFRLNMNETLQHWVLMISFIALVISGFALRFGESWWVQLLFGWGDGAGFLLRGTIHRISAVAFVLLMVWHVLYLFTKRGRAMLGEMIGQKRDLVHIKENSLYFLGRRDTPPRFGTFTYMEKCEYWALAWGAGIMAATGFLLWFDNYFITRWHLPKGVLDVMLVIHYYEAWLATLAIIVWHIYGTVFKPGVYPMNPAWLAGRMPKQMYLEEHPDGPKLKARRVRRYYEDEEETTPSGEPATDETAESTADGVGESAGGEPSQEETRQDAKPSDRP